MGNPWHRGDAPGSKSAVTRHDTPDGAKERSNKAMKLTSPEPIGGSQAVFGGLPEVAG